VQAPWEARRSARSRNLRALKAATGSQAISRRFSLKKWTLSRPRRDIAKNAKYKGSSPCAAPSRDAFSAWR
jgi:hypothetical protein